MKKVVYLISAVVPSADILAAELALTLREKFPFAHAVGIVGPSLQRAAVEPLATMASVHQNGLLAKTPTKLDAHLQESYLLEKITRENPKLAILVGYDHFHKRLAEAMRLRKIPVILYGAPNISEWGSPEIAYLKQHVQKVLGVFPFEVDVFGSAGIDYAFVGSPHKDRTSKVVVSHATIGLPNADTIIAVLPGSTKEKFRQILPLTSRVKALLEEMSPGRFLFVLPLPPTLTFADLQGLDVKTAAETRDGCFHQGYFVVKGMALEVVHLATAAIVSNGTPTLECALLGTPHVALTLASEFAPPSQYQSMVNQVAGRKVVDEFSLETDARRIALSLLELADDTPKRQTVLKDFESLKRSLRGFAAENAAEMIGLHLAQQRVRRRNG